MVEDFPKGNDVHLWCCRPGEVKHAEHHLSVLTPLEQKKYHRYRFDRHRHAYLVTRLFIRSLLSHYDDSIEPSQWRFHKNRWGKPFIKLSQNPRGLMFNLSHTDKLIVCAISQNSQVGVDVENIQRSSETTKIADRYFSPAEVEALQALPADKQRARFFDYWTLKEAFIKAKGKGLAIPLRDFSFKLDTTEYIGIEFAGSLAQERPDRWHFQQWQTDEKEFISLAWQGVAAPQVQHRYSADLEWVFDANLKPRG